MADVWRPRVSRLHRRDRSLGTIDGRLVQASKVKKKDDTRRPSDDYRPVQFNSGSSITDGDMSPPFIVPSDSVIVGLTLSVEDGGVTAKVYVNGSRKTSISHSGGGYGEKDGLDIGVDAGDKITVSYSINSGSPTKAVTTVGILED